MSEIKKFKTAFVQHGVASEIGFDQSDKTIVCAALVGGDYNNPPYLFFKGQSSEYDAYFTVLYEVEVKHPYIYIGSEDERRDSIIRYTVKKLKEEGVLKEYETRSGLVRDYFVKIND